MKSFRANFALKAMAAVLCVLTATLALGSSVVTLANWDDLWSGGDFYQSYSIYRPMAYYQNRVNSLMDLRMELEWYGKLSYSDRERLKALEEELSPENTNFRYQIHDQETSELLADSMGGSALGSLAGQERTVVGIMQGDSYRYYDVIRTDNDSGRDILEAATPEGPVLVDAGDYPEQYCPYGRYSDGENWMDYDGAYDTRYHKRSIAIDMGVSVPLAVHDQFWEAREDYDYIQQFLPMIAVTAGVTLFLAAVLLIFLCRGAGYRRESPERVTPGWQERIPTDVYAVLYVLVLSFVMGAGDSAAYNLNQFANTAAMVGVGLFAVIGVSATLAALLTAVVRLKLHTFWSGMLLWRAGWAVGRFLRGMFRNWSMTKRVVWLFLLYLLGTVLTGVTLILIPFYQGFVLWALCRWVRQWRQVRAATGRIVGGDPDCRIDAAKFYPDLQEHAEQLNDLGSAIGNAVDEKLRSERFKAELITNVSHDLKTPLTSIINYVDLLKKEDIQDPKAQEYLEVLDRKSQRLKKLTEDLVEASKASTGTLAVTKERLGFTQLLAQALGEYEEKFEKSGLEPVLTSPDHELYVEADGRHLWRVIDNLLGNCVKYAMPGTRVYLDVKAWDGNVTMSVKNISRAPLNIPAEQLMERFVRGDESRTAEGSGLGLSIARSLTELQGGTFRLDIDGDLFKAVVVFPEYREPMPLPEGEQ